LRVISALSRFDETPAEVTVERDADGTFVALEPNQAYEKNRVKTAITDMAPRSPELALSLDAFWAEIANSKRSTVNDALKTLVADGIMQRTGKGTRGNPYLFWVANEPEALAEMFLLDQKKPSKETASEPQGHDGISFSGTSPLRSRGSTDKRIPRPEINGPTVLSEQKKPAPDLDELLGDDED
jgi:hypothetical protein